MTQLSFHDFDLVYVKNLEVAETYLKNPWQTNT